MPRPIHDHLDKGCWTCRTAWTHVALIERGDKRVATRTRPRPKPGRRGRVDVSTDDSAAGSERDHVTSRSVRVGSRDEPPAGERLVSTRFLVARVRCRGSGIEAEP